MTVPGTRRCTRVKVRLLAEMQVQGENRAVYHDDQVAELNDRGASFDVSTPAGYGQVAKALVSVTGWAAWPSEFS